MKTGGSTHFYNTTKEQHTQSAYKKTFLGA